VNLITFLPLTKNKLAVLFEIYAAEEDYLRSLHKKTGINVSLLHRILKNFIDAEVVTRKLKGKEVYYCLNPKSLLFLRSLIERYHSDTVVYNDSILKYLLKLIFENKDFFRQCQKIYLFGSFTRGNVKEGSDIDLLFVTKNKKKVLEWCKSTSLLLQREISPLIYDPLKFKKDLSKGDALLKSIIAVVKNRVILKE
jgi:predicted nucleotidyltransferase